MFWWNFFSQPPVYCYKTVCVALPLWTQYNLGSKRSIRFQVSSMHVSFTKPSTIFAAPSLRLTRTRTEEHLYFPFSACIFKTSLYIFIGTRKPSKIFRIMWALFINFLSNSREFLYETQKVDGKICVFTSLTGIQLFR